MPLHHWENIIPPPPTPTPRLPLRHTDPVAFANIDHSVRVAIGHIRFPVAFRIGQSDTDAIKLRLIARARLATPHGLEP